MRGFRAERAALHRDLVNQHVVNMVNNMGRDVPDVQPARPVERPPSYTAVVGSGNYRVTMRRASQSTTESLVETAPPSYSQILVRKELKSESSTE
uniref:Uncharacterized protein n=1 Tax=Steinernema glaseri TaxID=37863 RepID=A0A1I7Z0M9_9BILA